MHNGLWRIMFDPVSTLQSCLVFSSVLSKLAVNLLSYECWEEGEMYYIAFGLPLDPEFLRFMKTAYNFISGWKWKKGFGSIYFLSFLLHGLLKNTLGVLALSFPISSLWSLSCLFDFFHNQMEFLLCSYRVFNCSLPRHRPVSLQFSQHFQSHLLCFFHIFKLFGLHFVNMNICQMPSLCKTSYPRNHFPFLCLMPVPLCSVACVIFCFVSCSLFFILSSFWS